MRHYVKRCLTRWERMSATCKTLLRLGNKKRYIRPKDLKQFRALSFLNDPDGDITTDPRQINDTITSHIYMHRIFQITFLIRQLNFFNTPGNSWLAFFDPFSDESWAPNPPLRSNTKSPTTPHYDRR